MTEPVERFGECGDWDSVHIASRSDGEYVLYSDYESLRQQLEAAQTENDEYQRALKLSGGSLMKAIAEIAALSQRLSQCEADAGRYKLIKYMGGKPWLGEVYPATLEPVIYLENANLQIQKIFECMHGNNLDEVLDAATAAAGE